MNITHGMCETPTYSTWHAILSRAGKSKRYELITVCERWRDIKNFVEDMGLRPEGMIIDRIDNAKGYCKENCRWVTPSQSNANRYSIKRASGFKIAKGVVRRVKKKGIMYEASIKVHHKQYYLGIYNSMEEASMVYRKAYKKHWGEMPPKR